MYSDGSLSPKDLYKQACNCGLKHMAITDHHDTRAFQHIREWRKNESEDRSDSPSLWTGIEISCLLDNCLVHMLGLGFNNSHKSLLPYTFGDPATGSSLRAENVITAIHQAGGIAILAHPARYRKGFRELINSAADINIDGAEAWYDYEYESRWTASRFVCSQVDKQLKSLGLLSTCGTDTHGYDITCR